MKKRFLSLFLALALIPLPVVGFAEEQTVLTAQEQAAEKGFGYEHKITSEEAIMFVDFEGFKLGSNMTGLEGVSGTYYPKEGPTGDICLAMDGGGSMIFPVPDAITSGKYVLSFDYLQNKNNASFGYMRFNRGTGYEESNYFGVRDGKAGYITNNWGTYGVDYTEDTWIHVNMFMNFDSNMIYYYIDNELFSEQSGLVDIHKIDFAWEGDFGLIRCIDNIAMYPVTNKLREELNSLKINMPYDFSSDLELKLYSKYSGNIFNDFSDNEMLLEVYNKTEEEIAYDIEYYIEDFAFQRVDEGKLEGFTLQGGERATCTIKPDVKKYDIYTLYASAVPKDDGKDTFTIDREFSMVNTPSPGYKNLRFGTCTHPGRGNTSWPEVQRAVEISGLGFTRTDGSWGAFERQKGVYDGSSHFEAEASTAPNFFADRAAEGMQNLLIFDPSNYLYHNGSYKEVANDPEALLALERASENLARMYKGKIHVFELGNELNFQRIEVMAPEDYAKVCQAAYRGLKKGNPDCTVLSMGHSRPATDLFERYLAVPGGRPFDDASIHIYAAQGYPDTTEWEFMAKQTKDAIARSGYSNDDMKLWVTESGMNVHTSYGTDQQVENVLVRQFVLTECFNAVDKFIMYQLQTYETDPNNPEDWYGCLQGRGTKNANGARKRYLGVCNYIAMTENAEVLEGQRYDNNETVYGRMKKPNGNYLTVMYTTHKAKDVTIDFGSDQGIVYDVDGNPTILNSSDGKYTVTLTDSPIYFETPGEKFEIIETEVKRDKEKIELSDGDTGTFNLTLPENSTIELVGTQNMTVTDVQEGNEVTVTVTADTMPRFVTLKGLGDKAGMFTEHRMADGTQIFRDYIYGYIKQGDVTTDMILLPVEYAYMSADVRMGIKPYDNTNTKRWKGFVTVKNNKSVPISGTVTMTSPECMSEVRPMRVSQLQPGETVVLEFNMPYESMKGTCLRGGEFVIDNGERIEFYLGNKPRSKNFRDPKVPLEVNVLEKVKDEETKIDGVIDAEEWQNFKLYDFDKSQVSYGNQGNNIDGVIERDTFGADADYGGLDDFSGSVYAKWDEEYLYVAAIVKDDVHWQKQDIRSMYYDDVLFVGGTETVNQRHDSRVYVALSEFDDCELFAERFPHGRVWCNWTNIIHGRNARALDLEEQDKPECYVVRNENVTIYEAKLSWRDIMTEEAIDRRQAYLYFSIRDYDGDRDKTHNWGSWFVLTNTKGLK